MIAKLKFILRASYFCEKYSICLYELVMLSFIINLHAIIN